MTIVVLGRKLPIYLLSWRRVTRYGSRNRALTRTLNRITRKPRATLRILRQKSRIDNSLHLTGRRNIQKKEQLTIRGGTPLARQRTLDETLLTKDTQKKEMDHGKNHGIKIALRTIVKCRKLPRKRRRNKRKDPLINLLEHRT